MPSLAVCVFQQSHSFFSCSCFDNRPQCQFYWPFSIPWKLCCLVYFLHLFLFIIYSLWFMIHSCHYFQVNQLHYTPSVSIWFPSLWASYLSSMKLRDGLVNKHQAYTVLNPTWVVKPILWNQAYYEVLCGIKAKLISSSGQMCAKSKRKWLQTSFNFQESSVARKWNLCLSDCICHMLHWFSEFPLCPPCTIRVLSR